MMPVKPKKKIKSVRLSIMLLKKLMKSMIYQSKNMTATTAVDFLDNTGESGTLR